MKRLFIKKNGLPHCLAVRETVREGLCAKLGDKIVNFISNDNIVEGVKIKIKNTIYTLGYSVVGLFVFCTYDGYKDGKRYIEYTVYEIENGIVTSKIIDNLKRQIAYDRYSGLFYYYYSYANGGGAYFGYSVDGINYKERNLLDETVYNEIVSMRQFDPNSWSLEFPYISEIIPDDNGGFEFVIYYRADNISGYTSKAVFARSFWINTETGEIVPTNKVSYYDWQSGVNYPQVPKFFDGYTQKTTVKGYESIQISTGSYPFDDQWKFFKSETDYYILNTVKVVYDPISDYFFIIKLEKKGSSNYYADVKLYKSRDLNENNFILVSTLYENLYYENYVRFKNIVTVRLSEVV